MTFGDWIEITDSNVYRTYHIHIGDSHYCDARIGMGVLDTLIDYDINHAKIEPNGDISIFLIRDYKQGGN